MPVSTKGICSGRRSNARPACSPSELTRTRANASITLSAATIVPSGVAFVESVQIDLLSAAR